jgi:FkbM family methyltransferase
MKLRREEPVLVFGAGRFGRDVAATLGAEGYQVEGFLQTDPTSPVVDEKRVYTWREVTDRERSWQVVVGIFNRQTHYDGLADLLQANGFRSIQFPWETYAQVGSRLGWRYWLESPAYLDAHQEEIEATIERMADEVSQQTLRRLVDFRRGRDLRYSSLVSPEPQYFNALTLPCLTGRPVVYVDGGAYDGDTFRALRSQVDLSQAYLFEPDPENFARLTAGLKEEPSEVLCFPVGLSNRHQLVSFQTGVGEAAAMVAGGEGTILTVRLDDVLPTARIDLLKLDVEGGEAAALQGAASLLARSRPVLVLSLYHRPDDLWRLPALVTSLIPGYRLYVRQHWFNSFDLVLYAIPEA